MTPFVRDRRANFRQSLRVLERAKEEGTKVTKTSMMLGVGEDEDGVMRALKGSCHFLSGNVGIELTNSSSFSAQTLDCSTYSFACLQRRRSYLRPIHATDQTAHESGSLCRPSRV